MPCLLKERTSTSPGVITFTHNEALVGIPARFGRVSALLERERKEGRWILGVHVQGDCSWLKWKLARWQSFVLWPEPNAPFLSEVPGSAKIGLNCSQFMDTGVWGRNDPLPDDQRIFDLCVVSRPSPIKRIRETLEIARAFLNQRPGARIIFVVPDPRKLENGTRTYKRDGIDRTFFERPLDLFSANELRQITFVSSSVQSFGRFPLSTEFLSNIYRNSRLLLLPSHQEGTPRVFLEALMSGTPCAYSKNLVSGLNSLLTPERSLAIDDNPELAARQLLDALEHTDRFRIDREAILDAYGDKANGPRLQASISSVIRAEGQGVEGRWFLSHLDTRLACHGGKLNYQFLRNEHVFDTWFERVNTLSSDADPYNEDWLYGTDPDFDRIPFQAVGDALTSVRDRSKHMIKTLIRRRSLA
jgi:glycosyltransferase involved in cell wall biosynthesis